MPPNLNIHTGSLQGVNVPGLSVHASRVPAPRHSSGIDAGANDAGKITTGTTNLDAVNVAFSPLPGWLLCLLLLLPLLILLPGLTDFPYASASQPYSDLTLSHYPNTLFLRQALQEYGRIPLWSPLILGGAPFAANPLSGLWYPPGWLALLLPLPLAFNLLVLLHLLWGGVGMYLLLRREGLGQPAALLGALAFEAMPKLFAHYGAGHLTLMYAVPWTPWLLWAAHRRLEAAAQPESRFHRLPLLEALVLALIFLADVRWAAYAGLAWLAYTLAAGRVGSTSSAGWFPRLAGVAVQAVLAGMLAAPLGLPLLEFVRHSSRGQMASQDVLTFSLPPARLLGLVFPDLGGFHEWMLYVGGAIFLLSVLALLWGGGRVCFWGGLALVALIYALGSYVPGLEALARLPGFDLLRVPARALFLLAMALAALAAWAVERLLSEISPSQRRRAGLALTALAGFTVILAAAGWLAAGGRNFLLGGGVILVSAVWIGLRLGGRVTPRLWGLGLLLLCLVDWAVIDLSVFEPLPTQEVLAQGEELARFLAQQAGDFRVYSPSLSLPPHTAARYRLQMADGVDPMQAANYVAYMQRAVGVPWNGYSVTLPPFANGDPSQDNAAYLPDLGLLSKLNVRYIAAEFDMNLGLPLAGRFGETRLYQLEHVFPRAWVLNVSADLTGEPAWRMVRAADLRLWSPNRIEVGASGPGILKLAEVFYPGWWAWVDGQPVNIQAYEGALRSVELGPGEHTVVFEFRPLLLYVGLSLCGLALILLSLHRWRFPGAYE